MIRGFTVIPRDRQQYIVRYQGTVQFARHGQYIFSHMNGVAAFAFGYSNGGHLAFLTGLRFLTDSITHGNHSVHCGTKTDARIMTGIGRTIYNARHIAQIHRTIVNMLDDGSAHFP